MQIPIEQALKEHEQCRQYFIDATAAIRSHLEVGQKTHARYELLRANASIAQGLVYADLLGICSAGWFDRMREVERYAKQLDCWIP